jgi:Tetratricopeptide repeat
VLGPDHLFTLLAATALTLALVAVGEVEPARALGEDTLQRSRRVLGPGHPVTLYLTQAVSSGQLHLDDDAAQDHPSRPL